MFFCIHKICCSKTQQKYQDLQLPATYQKIVQLMDPLPPQRSYHVHHTQALSEVYLIYRLCATREKHIHNQRNGQLLSKKTKWRHLCGVSKYLVILERMANCGTCKSLSIIFCSKLKYYRSVFFEMEATGWIILWLKMTRRVKIK